MPDSPGAEGVQPPGRFEIRYANQGETDNDPWHVLGWHHNRSGANRMAASWSLHPTVKEAWVVDAYVKDAGDFAGKTPTAESANG